MNAVAPEKSERVQTDGQGRSHAECHHRDEGGREGLGEFSDNCLLVTRSFFFWRIGVNWRILDMCLSLFWIWMLGGCGSGFCVDGLGDLGFVGQVANKG